MTTRELYFDTRGSMKFYVFLSISQVFSLIPKRLGPITSAQGKNEIRKMERRTTVEQGIIRGQEEAIGNRAKR